MLLGRDGNFQVSRDSREVAVQDLKQVSSSWAPLIFCVHPALQRGLWALLHVVGWLAASLVSVQ